MEKAKYNKKKLAISTSTSRDNVTLLLRCLKENPEDLFSAKRANIETAVNPSQYSIGDNFDEADYFLTSFLLEQLPKSLRTRLSL